MKPFGTIRAAVPVLLMMTLAGLADDMQETYQKGTVTAVSSGKHKVYDLTSQAAVAMVAFGRESAEPRSTN